MKWDEVFCNTFKALRSDPSDIRHQLDFILPSLPMVQACRADDFDFFQPFIAAGKLTVDQMHHAAEQYRLGKSKSGKPIFWMIDEMLQVHDGHLGDQWVTQLLKAREPELMQCYFVQHCLFGLHLLTNTNHPFNEHKSHESNHNSCHSCDSCSGKEPVVSIVESEKSAVILSELFPEHIWLAYAYPANMTPQLLEPLQGRTVTIYPRTDPLMDSYVSFLEFADGVRRLYDIDLVIDDILEQHATAAQKERQIDLLDFILESTS